MRKRTLPRLNHRTSVSTSKPLCFYCCVKYLFKLIRKSICHQCFTIQKAVIWTSGFICLTLETNPLLFPIIEAAPSVQTLTQFFHCNISSSKNFAVVLYLSAPVERAESSRQKKFFLDGITSNKSYIS